MNVLIVNASPRRKGVTSTLLSEAEKVINSEHNVESVRIQELNIKPCIGCLNCRPDKICILPKDDAHSLAEKIRGSDYLIIGSPVYWGNMPGTLKIFFDRNVPLFEYCEVKSIKYIPKPKLIGKKAILIVSGAAHFHTISYRPRAKGPFVHLKQFLNPAV